MTVLLADKFPEKHIREIEKNGCMVGYQSALNEATLPESVSENKPDILVVRSTPVSAAVLDAFVGLNLIIRAGAGVNTIDVDAASARSIYVANCPGKNSIAVAELAFGHLLSLDRRIPDNVTDLTQGVWNKKEYSNAKGLYGRTLGIVGLGRIGREMIGRAHAFGMHVVAWSRSLTPELAERLGIRIVNSPIEVAEHADAVSVHLALTEDTRGILGQSFFKAMKPGAYFINTARAEVIDENALEQAIREKEIRAGLDVFSSEPSGSSGHVACRLFDLPGAYGTHHIGASTDQAQNAVADEVLRIVSTYRQSGHVENCVNSARRTPARCILSVHHRNRVGVLAMVLGIIKENGINVDSMTNVLFEGGEGACANIQIESSLSSEALHKIETSSSDVRSVNMHEIAASTAEQG